MHRRRPRGRFADGLFAGLEALPVRASECQSRLSRAVGGVVGWYDCLRALGLRVRGLYCTKDTYVTRALQTVRDPRWVEKQTGVGLATLKVHYEKWMPDPSRTELRRLEAGLGNSELCPPEDLAGTNPRFPSEIAGAGVRGGGLEPPRVLPH